MFVTAEDFDVPPFDLPNLGQVNNSFTEYIDEQEEAELSKLLGVTLWEAFKDGLAALPASWVVGTAYVVDALVVYGSDIYKALQNSTGVVPTSDPAKWELQASNRWLLLKVGAAYSYSDIPYVWAGMQKLVKPLIHSLWLRDAIDNQVTGSGVSKGVAENSTAYNPNIRVCESWNKYDAMAYGTRNDRIKNCLFGYLYANSTVFDDVVTPGYSDFIQYLWAEFTCPGRQNIFDL